MKVFLWLLLHAVTMAALAEIFQRTQNQSPKFAFDWVYHPVLGHTGPRGEIVRTGGGGRYHENLYSDLGFRSDWLVTPQPQPGARSVLILGDSMTEANDLPREVTYPGLLRERLSREGEVRVHTFASSDYGSLDQTLALHLYGAKAKPDAIVLQFLGLNDFVNNSLALAGRNKSESDFSRAYVIPESMRGAVSPVFFLGDLPITHQSPWRSFLLEHSALFRAVYAHKTARIWQHAAVNGYPEMACPHELELFLEKNSQAWVDALEVTGRILRQLRREAGDVPVLGVYFPSNIETDEEHWTKGIAPQLARCFPGVPHRRLLGESRFLSLAAEAGIRAFSLRPAMWKAAPSRLTKDRFYLPGGHFSPAGHQLAAEEISRAIDPPLVPGVHPGHQ